MLKSLRVIALYLGIGILLAFLLFTANQILQIYGTVSTIHPIAGWAVASLLTGTFLGLFGVPVAMYYQLPDALSPPENKHSKEFEEHLRALKNRLEKNQRVDSKALTTRQDIEEAIEELDSHADEHIQDTALSLFVSTAVSQNGRLDGLLVLASQIRMVWKIAHIYYQRPAIRDLVWLYSQVAAATFMATEIEDVDLSDELEPFIEQAVGSVSAAVPVVGSTASFFVESVLTGTANAFFTLRVGVVAKEYCGMLTKKNERQVRNTASAQASSMINSVVKKGSSKLADVVKDVASDKSKKASQWAKGKAEEHRQKLLAKVGLASTEDKQEAKAEDPSDV